MRVLITGGAGFIGSTLADRLIRDGHGVAVVDNEATGCRADVSSDAAYHKGDVTAVGDLKPIFSDGLDAVCHIAGQVSIVQSFANPEIDLRTNVEGTLNVLRLCIDHQVPRLLFASSMMVYGEAAMLPTPETAPSQPNSYYGITKSAAERYVHATALRLDLGMDLNVTSFRMYNVFGPRQSLDNPYQGVLGIFLGNILRGEPLMIFGDGNQSRDFVYVDDVVDAWSTALADPGCYGRIINLGSGRQRTINSLADAALAVCGYTRDTYDVRHVPGRAGEQRHVEADIQLAKEILGWLPRTGFEAGLAETVRWAKAAAGRGFDRHA